MAEVVFASGDNLRDGVVNLSQNMLDKFLNENYTVEQQQEIRNNIDKSLQENSGTTRISWKEPNADENGNDTVSIYYKGGQIKSFEEL